jgi:hypothetical protein
MALSQSKTTTPDDFLELKTYKDPNGNTIEGEFLVFVSGVSLCCRDNTGYIEPIPIIISNP